MKLMIVESPNKIKKLESILGSDWKVLASVGHIRDLPRKAMGINDDLTLQYEFIPAAKVGKSTFPGGKERVARIKKSLSNCEMVYIATDPDREGEAIAWHLKETLNLDEEDYERITFDSITDSAIHSAIADSRKIDYELVYAQEARRALDRMFGYMVSPLLSDNLGMQLSAGRVQSPAVRLVQEREEAITKFKKTDHFGAVVKFDFGKWTAEWDTKAFVTEDSPYIMDQEIAEKAAQSRMFSVVESESKNSKKSPPSAFSTSLLLQAASVSLKFDPQVTAKLAQKLFEQGVITYIRTDSINISDEAIDEVREYAKEKNWDLPDKRRTFKVKGNVQEAHEAVRPTHINVEEAGENDKEKALYKLIWQRTVACQLADAIYKVNTVKLLAKDSIDKFEFKAKGRVLIDAGWKVLTENDAAEDITGNNPDEDGSVPVLDINSTKQAESGELKKKATKPPARYTQASLIKKLESEGVGRPATYPAIMSNIMHKSYITEKKRFLSPSEIGASLVKHLITAKFEFIELDYTRNLELELDKVAAGTKTYLSVVEPALAQLNEDIERAKADGSVKPKFPCVKCDSGLRRIARVNKTPFWCCTSKECSTFYDDVDGKPQEQKTYKCKKCETGELRRFKRKSSPGHLWACTNDECKTFLDDVKGIPTEPTVHTCPKCKTAPLRRFQKKDKETGKPKGFAWFCTDRECVTFMDDKGGKPFTPPSSPCPSCGKPMYRRKGQYGFFWGCSGFKDGCKVIMKDSKGKPVKKVTKKKKSAA